MLCYTVWVYSGCEEVEVVVVVVVGLSTDLAANGGCCFEVLLRLRTTLQGMSERAKE